MDSENLCNIARLMKVIGGGVRHEIIKVTLHGYTSGSLVYFHFYASRMDSEMQGFSTRMLRIKKDELHSPTCGHETSGVFSDFLTYKYIQTRAETVWTAKCRMFNFV